MSRAIFVLSTPRSGSTATAGALHRLGVDMGEGHLQRPDASNERGYYEDLRWQRINKQLAGYRYETRKVWTLPARQAEQYRLLAAECAQAPLWGVKGPRLAFTFHLVHPLVAHFAKVRVVVVQRARAEVIASLIRHSQVAYGGALRMAEHEAVRLLERWETALAHSLGSFHGPVHVVEYGELMGANQVAELHALEAFCTEGLDVQRRGIEEALRWLDPGLRHHGNGAGL